MRSVRRAEARQFDQEDAVRGKLPNVVYEFSTQHRVEGGPEAGTNRIHSNSTSEVGDL